MSDVEARLRDLETDVAVIKNDQRHTQEAIDKINANTSKVFWLVAALAIKTAWDYFASLGQAPGV